jgi:glucose/arabinose dehydrogenase
MPNAHSVLSGLAAAVLLGCSSSCGDNGIITPGTTTIRLQQVVSGLTAPVYLTSPAGDARQFVVEQPGRIRIIANGQLVATPFLDITAKVQYGGEQGLLSVAFHPQYSANGLFFVYYTRRPDGDIIIERYRVSANTSVADATSAKQILVVPHRAASNHNGGLALFGPDGMLYIGTGDGGGGGDVPNNAQNLTLLLGKLLRIDVNTGDPYSIPASNPYVAGTGGARGEIWASGLRNPWRFAFDRTTDNLYVADVGQGEWEEVNVVSAATKPVNYGWRIMEGAHCYNPSTNCNTAGLTQPVHEYNHSGGKCSITGGFVYRGTVLTGIAGTYFFADYCEGKVRSFRLANNVATNIQEYDLGNLGFVTSFGEDAAGELYVLSVLSGEGRVNKIVPGP